MTDIEIVQACARAMGYEFDEHAVANDAGTVITSTSRWHRFSFWPLTNRAQAFALQVACRLGISPPAVNGGHWAVSGDGIGTIDADLRRAICECVANMQRAKEART